MSLTTLRTKIIIPTLPKITRSYPRKSSLQTIHTPLNNFIDNYKLNVNRRAAQYRCCSPKYTNINISKQYTDKPMLHVPPTLSNITLNITHQCHIKTHGYAAVSLPGRTLQTQNNSQQHRKQEKTRTDIIYKSFDNKSFRTSLFTLISYTNNRIDLINHHTGESIYTEFTEYVVYRNSKTIIYLRTAHNTRIIITYIILSVVFVYFVTNRNMYLRPCLYENNIIQQVTFYTNNKPSIYTSLQCQ